MGYMTQMAIWFEFFKEFMRETFGGGIVFKDSVQFPTAPGYTQGYVK